MPKNEQVWRINQRPTSGSVYGGGGGGGAPGGGTSQAPLAGVDIHITEGRRVNRAGNRILRFDADGDPLAEYEFSEAGFAAANADARTDDRDVLWLPPGDIPGDHTFKSQVEYQGESLRTRFTGQITLADQSILHNCRVVRSGDQAGALIGVLGPASGTAYLRGVFVDVVNAGGPAVGVKTQAGQVAIHDGSVWATATAVDAPAYGVYTADEGTARVMNATVRAISEAGEGWALVRSATGGDGTADGCVLEYTTGAVLEEE